MTTPSRYAELRVLAIHKRMTEGASKALDWVAAVVVFSGIGLLLGWRG